MKRFLLVAGGSIQDSFATEYLKAEKFDCILAADSGMEFFYRNGFVPDVIIGDFDSVRQETLSYFKEKEQILWQELNPVKDDTDTESAIRRAISMGAEEIVVLGATGTRLDHVLGNIELLGIGLLEHVKIYLLDAYNRIQMIDNGIQLDKQNQFGDYVSLIPYTQSVKGLTLTGMKYSLDHYELKGFCSLGISNEIQEDVAEISFEDGILIVVESRDRM